jgi:hypothetical protein
MATVHRQLDEIDVRDSEVETDATDGHDNDDHPRVARWGSGVPGPLYRFRNAGSLALSAGVVGGILAYSWGLLPAWAGFLAGMLATVVATAVTQARNDARRSAQRTTAAR